MGVPSKVNFWEDPLLNHSLRGTPDHTTPQKHTLWGKTKGPKLGGVIWAWCVCGVGAVF